MKKLAPLPKPITSKNPVVILKHVCKLIKAEPKRYDQYESLVTEKNSLGFKGSDYFPACGTVGCVAGWVHLVTGGRRSGPVLSSARHILGLSEEEADDFFAAHPLGVRSRSEVTPRQHAADGIQHIKRFVLKKWGKKI